MKRYHVSSFIKVLGLILAMASVVSCGGGGGGGAAETSATNDCTWNQSNWNNCNWQ